ncbi:MAG: efflux RND transporter permease subunit [Myxococcota bacterium]
MSGFDLFIKRPVFTWMVIASLLVFGVLGYARLGVDQYPAMDFPVVTVMANLEGASPEVVEEDVTDILEEYINTIAGLRSLESETSQGVSLIRAEFELDVDIDVAAQDVRDKIAQARYLLPEDVEPPIVLKEDFGDQPVLWVPIHSQRPIVDSSEYVRHHVKPRVETVPGVAGVVLFGRQDRAIRIWLKGDELRSRGLAASDVVAAVQREHVEVPGGAVESRRLDYSVRTDAEFRSVAELERLVVAWQDGAPVRLADVARLEDGAEDLRHVAKFDGEQTVGIGIRKQSGANTVAVVDAVYDRVEQMAPEFPADFTYKRGADFSKPIREAVDETLFALVFGATLATLTVLVFLRRWRPTLVVGLAIPISLIATFGVMWLFDYTLNTMTLLAMALAVGVVIDDAIVVLENIERRREEGEEPLEAASRGTAQIAFAATAATVAIAVVFLPVIFVDGIVGSFLGEFGATVASAVMISLIVALTLVPMLAARMPPPRERTHGSIYHRLEQGFEWLAASYRQLLDWALAHRAATLGIAAASFAAALGIGSQIDGEFFPATDNGLFLVLFETPEGTSLDVTAEYLRRNEDWVLAQPEIDGVFSGAGFSPGRGSDNHSAGMMFVMLKSKNDRERTAQELVIDTRKALQTIPGQKVQVFNLSNMGVSGDGDFAFEIRGNLALDDLNVLAEDFMRRLTELPGYVDVDKSLKLGLPEVRVVPDRDKAAALGVDARTLATTIQAMIGGMDIATFKEAGKRFDIRVRLEEGDRNRPASIGNLYVRTRDGGVVELANLVDVSMGAAPAKITRSDRQRSVTISGNLEGKKLERAVEEAEAIAAELLPEGVTMAPSGEAEEFKEGFAQFGVAMGLAILVIYMVLAAQFESFVHPLTVMLALPLAMVGALGALWLLDLAGKPGMTLNLFSLIGIILLMGLVTKNSILLVDYANQLRDEGMDKVTAMRTAAPVRMRPVLMTALSMIFGVLPAALGVGPGAESRSPMAVAVAAGMLSSTVLTLVVVPVFYVVLDDGVEWVKSRARRLLGLPPVQSEAQAG